MTHTHEDFFAALLDELGLVVRPAALRSLAAVSIFESSEGNNDWMNPLAVTLYAPGAVPYNTFGDLQHVWRYPSFDVGVQVTATLLSGLHWDAVRVALRDRVWRVPILAAFKNAYTWVDWATGATFDRPTAELDARLAHPLVEPTWPRPPVKK